MQAQVLQRASCVEMWSGRRQWRAAAVRAMRWRSGEGMRTREAEAWRSRTKAGSDRSPLRAPNGIQTTQGYMLGVDREEGERWRPLTFGLGVQSRDEVRSGHISGAIDGRISGKR